MSGTIPTFQGWRDRITYILAEAQFLVAVANIILGLLVAWFEPSIPRVPAWLRTTAAATMILGPPLWIAGMRIVDWLRVRNWVTVHHINALEDEREKYLVPPELWDEKIVQGPPAYPVNDGAAWEVREFDYCEDDEELHVAGTWLGATADSKLVTSKAMLKDVHGVLIEGYLELARLRGRIERMGVEIQEETVLELMEATEEATMLDDTAVKDAFGDAREDAQQCELDDLPEIDEYQDEQTVEPASQQIAPNGGDSDGNP
jgi:hypothetical protein